MNCLTSATVSLSNFNIRSANLRLKGLKGAESTSQAPTGITVLLSGVMYDKQAANYCKIKQAVFYRAHVRTV